MNEQPYIFYRQPSHNFGQCPYFFKVSSFHQFIEDKLAIGLTLRFQDRFLLNYSNHNGHIKRNKPKEHINQNGYNKNDKQISPQDKGYLIQHWAGTSKLSFQGIADMGLTIVKKNTNEKKDFRSNFLQQPASASFREKEIRQSMMTTMNPLKLGLSTLKNHRNT